MGRNTRTSAAADGPSDETTPTPDSTDETTASSPADAAPLDAPPAEDGDELLVDGSIEAHTVDRPTDGDVLTGADTVAEEDPTPDADVPADQPVDTLSTFGEDTEQPRETAPRGEPLNPEAPKPPVSAGLDAPERPDPTAVAASSAPSNSGEAAAAALNARGDGEEAIISARGGEDLDPDKVFSPVDANGYRVCETALVVSRKVPPYDRRTRTLLLAKGRVLSEGAAESILTRIRNQDGQAERA